MGGNALKKVLTRRYARAEYYLLKERILNTLRERIPQFDVPREFPSKESFGDLDVLMVCPQDVKCEELITNLFRPTEIVENGGVYSFDVEQFQIDFILVPEDHFHNAIVYLSYSDLGGLIGNICHKIGLKYGIQGLWMNVHTKEFDPTTTSTKLILSRDTEQIFAFLGFDYAKYLQGFTDENEFFQWIAEGKYFRRVYFDDEQLNHAHRQRTSKRPIYIKFIAYLNKQEIARDAFDEEEQKSLVLSVRQQALLFFDKQNDYERGLNARDDKRKLREKYSGRYFTDIAKSPQMIPSLMKQFERRLTTNDDEFQQWVLDTDLKDIQAEVERFKEELKEKPM